MNDLPSRDDAKYVWTQYDNINRGGDTAARIAGAYADGVLMTEREWFEKHDEPTRIQKAADTIFRPHPEPEKVLREFGYSTDEMGVILGDTDDAS